jgi:hypothetical protein
MKDQSVRNNCLLALAVALGLSSAAASVLRAADIFINEPFNNSPALNGWLPYGATNLFAWDSNNHTLEVTWDSSQPNSYFIHPLGTVVNRSNDFTIAFDLRLKDTTVGVQFNKPGTFEIAVGLLNLASATEPSYLRGIANTPNLVEFAYFPDGGDISASVAPTITSTNMEWNDGGFTFPLKLETNQLFHIEMRFIAQQQKLTTHITRNGQPFGPVNDASLGSSFSDFQVDALAISSYSDAGQTDPEWSGSILAHGTVDNLAFICPPPVSDVQGRFNLGRWQVELPSLVNWTYTLERSTNFNDWALSSESVAGTGANIVLPDTGSPEAKTFYRVRATRP